MSETGQPAPVAARVSRARHDLRNPLGEILGFAEILREEAMEQGHAHLVRRFDAVCAEANLLLKKLNETLGAEKVHLHRESLTLLGDAITAFCRSVIHDVSELVTECRALPGTPFLEDLQRIADAARNMAERAPELLGDLFHKEDEIITPPTASQAGDRFKAVISGDTSFLHKVAAPVPGIPVEPAAILVVDDTEANRALLTRRLVREGHMATHAEDGQQALDMLRKQEYDLVLLDILMPRLTGDQVLAAMKSDPALQHIPVIMISGLDDLDSLIRCIQGGAEDYLTKPFDPVLLNARISASLEKKRLRDKEQIYLHQIRAAQEKSEALLLNIMPKSIAERLKSGENTIVDTLPEVTVLFADLTNFTELSARITGTEMVRLLDEIFTAFDLLAQQQGLEKIKTIGDAYMVVGGLPKPRPDHARACAELALNMLDAIERRFASTDLPLRIRIGISSGPVVAGVIGRHKFSYDLWGDTVNTASRMESHGLPGCIQVAEPTHQLLRDHYEFECRENLHVKGKGEMTAWLLKSRKAK